MRLISRLLLAIVLLASCNTIEVENSKTYIGAYRISDQQVPYPYIIHQKKDSIFLFNNKGLLLDRIKNSGIKSFDDLKFKQKHFKVLKKTEGDFVVFDVLDTINFKTFKNRKPITKFSAQFVKIENAKDLDIQKIKKEIESSIWKYDLIADENTNPNKDLEIKQLLQFKNDSISSITNYYYQGLKTVSEYETKAYTIFQINNFYFLSFQKEKDNPQPIYQIINYNSTSIELRDFSSREIKNIRYYKDSMDSEKYEELIKSTSSYSNCFDGYQAEYYFGEDVTFNKGNQYIIDYVNVNAPENETKSGYIIVHFNINCNSDVGRFGLIQMNREYKETSFSKEMVSHLLNKVSQLKDFPSTFSQSDWLNYKDVHAFLMFKLDKGKIVDLCP